MQRNLLIKSLVALALVSASAADLADNQIEDERAQGNLMVTRGRYAIKSCRACEQSQCQVMGMQRFSEPRCEAFGSLGAPCRPFQEAENKTLSFPNMLLYCDNVYMQFCPCARGLVCDLEQAQCIEAPSAKSTSTTSRPSEFQPRQLDNYPFTYVEPERYVYDDGFGQDDSMESEEESVPVAYVPLAYQRQESLTIRRRPQWMP